jgi:hypothetical protein
MNAEAFPLAWPHGWPRTPHGKQEDGSGRFTRNKWDGSKGWTFADARDRLIDEALKLGGRSVVLSTNFPLRRDGLPGARTGRIDDEGVAIYFALNGRTMAMACDRFRKAEHNMRSLTLAIEAMRQLERHGDGHMMERAFDGFAALPAPSSISWWHVLQVDRNASRTEIEAAFRRLARERHPDLAGGSDAMMADLNRARDEALRARQAA